MQNELVRMDEEIAKLRRFLMTVDTPGATISNYSGIHTSGGKRSDPTSRIALGYRSKAALELLEDIYMLERQRAALFHEIGTIKCSMETISERARFLINRLDIDGAEREAVLAEYRERYGSKDSDYCILIQRSTAYKRLTKYIEEILR